MRGPKKRLTPFGKMVVKALACLLYTSPGQIGFYRFALDLLGVVMVSGPMA